MLFRSLLLLIVTAVVTLPGAADAIPAFAKKYETKCSQCHNSWPRLNELGVKFKINGFQMVDSEDGGETGKIAPANNLFLDVGSANPPISARLEGGLVLKQPSAGPEDIQESKILCCVEGNAFTLDVGGTLAPNIGYWISLPWGKKNVAQGYLRFVNWFGPGLLGMDIGSMNVVDYDVVAAGREWFGLPLVAFHGSLYNNNAREIGFSAPHRDTGVRFYGRPKYDKFTYELGVYTGSQITGAADDDAGRAYTIMGRVDVKRFALSLRYWKNGSGMLDQAAVDSSGETLIFPADRDIADEGTEEFILSMRYLHPYFAVDFTLDKTTFTVGDRTITTNNVDHTLEQGSINRTAFSLNAIWFVNAWFETGFAYGLSQFDSYTQTVDNAANRIDGLDVSVVQLRFNIRPTMNMNIGLELQVDLTGDKARRRPDGTAFDAQNKAVLQWDLSL